ncbi:MAG: hemolysin [Candidatus Komeilibacteria bacterium CG11_big_fil_rev_8_21_14_0_20_36_20]|uniref:Hemolysin n=1 Tax=Candidatus Komeilibacteria bacterium CG11_big_fil_rev_8_21_14_0_20_36_20 TaxID=1974477 RepID=A0A2H0NCF2_9BACT|nr:MAG: hemolysin [Candidatus Komeilibacteria bacterium CG11_big_fil_rev_8_21_14_0_20_36_20]PIR81912.1 MAG: hypothetical protein COU21_01025 [Candidatus Komeilibacteria bacterium CG10_big_fil_rev_8_21_14_0_10_36_65]PJC55361.1 MAG: hypothetical protein CO027_02420 [Candidatus Komeilibacteria bacterium CG_4_9_14_0_2_um_filter_36_13]
MIFVYLTLLIILSAWFSGMEIALFSLSSAKIRSLILAKKPNAELLSKLLNNKPRLLVVILLGNNLVNIGAASLATVAAINTVGSAGVGLVTGGMTLLILIFGEMYPKAYFQIHAVKMALFFAPVIYFLQIILFPLLFLLEKLLFLLTKGKKREGVSETEFKAFSRLAVEKGVLDFEEHEMIMNVLEFNNTSVKNTMTPRYKMAVVDAEAEVDQVAYFMAQEGFSRYPVYHNQKDNIIGYVHAMDIMKVLNSDDREDQIIKHIQPIMKVNEREKVNLVFNKMRAEQTHITLVVRKNQQILGLVTMEDLLEELVGDIVDEKMS